ncbi:MAG TPA: hypothetical protein DC057_05820 [Spirochaetia bacterium]|nr:hypothetical protein [Spirochaetia bacterium]
MHTVAWTEKCKDCGGTGIYVGMAEQNSQYGIICNICKGSGKRERKFVYEEFHEKEFRDDVTVVLETNPGIFIGKNGKAFGGISYMDWWNGKQFPVGSEMRNFTCPAWWFQCADYSKKPKWEKCTYGAFSKCVHFSNKDQCWERWDEENKK